MRTRAGRKWEAVLQELRMQLPEDQFETWIRDIAVREFSPKSVELAVPSNWARDHLERNFRLQIESAIRSVARKSVALSFTVDETLSDGKETRISPLPEDAALVERIAGTPSRAASPPRWSEPKLNHKYTFENFIIGDCNRFAHHVAVEVAGNPGKTIYNPLFLHGGVGLGKTHLLQAICHQIRESNPAARITYLSCEGFINHYLQAVQHSALEAFRERFRAVDVLAVDDVHFLARRTEYLQEEFFHTFNTLQNAEHQILISSDRPPSEIPTLHERLSSRFGCGLVAELEKPDYETRAAILMNKLELIGKEFPEDVVSFIAERVSTNIRDLEGTIVKLVGFSSLMQRQITLELAHEVLRDILEEVPHPITITDIQRAVSEHFHVKPSDLQSKKRSKSIVFPRQICMFLARKLTEHSLEEIGCHFGGRDHTTVLYAEEKIRKLANTDTKLAALLNELTKKLSKRQ
ncbi:MAG: chromosomal replication initiator protein DnaA [Planctomycetota bacterium]|jgi:chromosomal replication initiator protein